MLALAQYWWVPTLRGVAAIAFGILAIVWPGIALLTLVALFGAFALIDGVIALAGLVRARGRTGETPWYLQLLVGITGLAAGIATFFYPGITSLVLLSFIAAYAIVVGISQFVSAVQQRGKPGAVALGISAVVSLAFGVFMVLRPEVGAVAVAWLIGVFAIAAGVALVSMGVILRNATVVGERLVSTMLPEVPEAERVRTKT